MAVTVETLLANVSVDVKNANKSLEALVSALKKTDKGFEGLNDSANTAAKGVSGFGFANVKVNAILGNMEKAAKAAGKALKFAFGDEFMSKAAESFERLGIEIENALSKGLQVDVGKEILAFLGEMLKGFQAIKPVIVDTIASIKAFAIASKAAFDSVNWEAVGKALAAIGAAAALAFSPAILSAVAGFAASMAAAVAPTLILAAKITLIVAGLAALAAVAEITVRNFDKLSEIIAGGMLIALEKATAAFAEFGISALQILTKIIVKAGELFPTFAGTALKAVTSLTDTMVELGEASKTATANADFFAESIKNNVANIDLGVTGEVIETVKNGISAFGEGWEKATKGATTHNFALRKTKAELEAIKKAQEEAKKEAEKAAALAKEQGMAAEEVFKKNYQLAIDMAMQEATINDQIQLRLDYELAMVDAKERELELNGKISQAAREGLKAQRELLKAQASQAKSRAPSAQFEAIAKGGEEIAKGISGVLSQGALDIVGGMASAVGAITSAANAVLDMIPNMLNSITELFNKLTDFPKVLLQAVQNLGRAAVRLVAEFIPNVLKAVPQIIDEIITALAEGIPDAFIQLLDQLPQLIDRFLDRLPELVEKFVIGLINASPRIMMAWVDFLVKEGPRIAMSIIKTFYTELPKAIIRGLAEGIKMLFKNFKDFFSGKGIKIDTKGITKAFKDLGRTLSGESSKLFAVTELSEVGKAATQAKQFAEGIVEGMEKAGNLLKQLWDGLLKALRDIWLWIYNNIIKPLLDGLKWLWENIVKPIIDGFVTALKWVWENVVRPVVDALVNGLTWVWQNVVKPIVDTIVGGLRLLWESVIRPIVDKLVDGLAATWMWVKNNIVDPLASIGYTGFIWVRQNIVDPLLNIGQQGFQWVYDNVVRPLQNVGSFFSNFRFPSLPSFSWPGLPEWHWPGIPKPEWLDSLTNIGGGGGGGGGGFIGSVGKSLGFAKGGPVYAADGYFAPKGTDTVPAMLTPGEFVVNRDAVSQLGLNAMNALNNGQMPKGGGDTVVNVHMNITTQQPIDESFIKNRVVPAVKEEFKRAGLDGRRLVPAGGVY